jgi:hypothetical protein
MRLGEGLEKNLKPLAAHSNWKDSSVTEWHFDAHLYDFDIGGEALAVS